MGLLHIDSAVNARL